MLLREHGDGRKGYSTNNVPIPLLKPVGEMNWVGPQRKKAYPPFKRIYYMPGVNPPNPPSQITSAGGDGNPFSGNGKVSVQAPPRPRPFPWPLPFSATQGAVGGTSGKGTVSVSLPPFYGPFNQYWPYQVPRLNGLPNNLVRS